MRLRRRRRGRRLGGRRRVGGGCPWGGGGGGEPRGGGGGRAVVWGPGGGPGPRGGGPGGPAGWRRRGRLLLWGRRRSRTLRGWARVDRTTGRLRLRPPTAAGVSRWSRRSAHDRLGHRAGVVGHARHLQGPRHGLRLRIGPRRK